MPVKREADVAPPAELMNDLIDQDAGPCDGAADLEGRAEGGTQDVGRDRACAWNFSRRRSFGSTGASGSRWSRGRDDSPTRRARDPALRLIATDWASPRWEACCRGLGEWRPPRRRVLPGKNAWRASFVHRSSFIWHKLLSRYRRRLRPK